ncbi:hypothetical protein FGB62_93g051 [Gracilaria domingensis]|nr:hypothetical protein FGB62_93g051 [Gracilaria domingensis]
MARENVEGKQRVAAGRNREMRFAKIGNRGVLTNKRGACSGRKQSGQEKLEGVLLEDEQANGVKKWVAHNSMPKIDHSPERDRDSGGREGEKERAGEVAPKQQDDNIWCGSTEETGLRTAHAGVRVERKEHACAVGGGGNLGTKHGDHTSTSHGTRAG